MKRLLLASALCVASFAFTLSGCASTGDTAKVGQAKPQAATGDAKTGCVKKVGYGKKAYRHLH